jgi:hypothetical protein
MIIALLGPKTKLNRQAGGDRFDFVPSPETHDIINTLGIQTWGRLMNNYTRVYEAQSSPHQWTNDIHALFCMNFATWHPSKEQRLGCGSMCQNHTGSWIRSKSPAANPTQSWCNAKLKSLGRDRHNQSSKTHSLGVLRRVR